MTVDEALKSKTVYKYRAYSIEQVIYDGRWKFMHYCPNGLTVRTWADNSRVIHDCEFCQEVIPEEIILLWGLIDKDPVKPPYPGFGAR
jgi:hypothetical protein